MQGPVGPDPIFDDIEFGIDTAVQVAEATVRQTHPTDVAGPATKGGPIHRGGGIGGQTGPADTAGDGVVRVTLILEQAHHLQEVVPPTPQFEGQPGQQSDDDERDAVAGAEGEIGKPDVGLIVVVDEVVDGLIASGALGGPGVFGQAGTRGKDGREPRD